MHAPREPLSYQLRLHEAETLELLRTALVDGEMGKIALVSSFGAESAVLLHLAARIKPDVAILFIDTRMLFAETLAYKTELTRFLGLTNVSTIAPDGGLIRETDPWGRMHLTDPDACCGFRKTAVLDTALARFDGWITGRKRFQSLTRSDLKPTERAANGKIKLNPLAAWEPEHLSEYAELFDLPQHPLINEGYKSIGCAACTSPVAEGEDGRAGRWRGQNKIECGIHIVDGKIIRETHTDVQ